MNQKKLAVLASLLLLGSIFCVILGIQHREKNSLPEGYLEFSYEEVGEYGDLYYQSFEGDRVLIATHLLGEDRRYFILDDERKLVFYTDNQHRFYFCKIGRSPKLLLTHIDQIFNDKSKSGRYILGKNYDDAENMSYVIIDKDKKIAHEVKTDIKCGRWQMQEEDVVFDEENETLYYKDLNENVYCSEQYEQPRILEEKNDIYFGEHSAQSRKESKYEFSLLTQEDDERDAALFMRQKGKCWLINYHVKDYVYMAEKNKLYYLDTEGNVRYVDVSQIEKIDIDPLLRVKTVVGEGKIVAEHMDAISDLESGRFIFAIQGEEYGEKEISVIEEEQVTLLTHTDQQVGLYEDDIIWIFDNYIVYLDRQPGNMRLMCYTPNAKVKILLEHVEEHELIKMGTYEYHGKLRYGQIAGYYYNELFDTYIELTKEQELIVYNEGEEKGKVEFNVDTFECIKNNKIKLSPIDQRVFSADVFSHIFWNDQDFLLPDTEVEKIYNEDGNRLEIKLGERILGLKQIDESTFKQLLKEEASNLKNEKEKQKQKVRSDEAILFTKWYMNYLGEEQSKQMMIELEDDDHYIIKVENGAQYEVDRQSGRVQPIDKIIDGGDRIYEDKMTYEIEKDILWMVDENGNRGRLIDLSALFLESQKEPVGKGYFLWQYESSIYFYVDKYWDFDGSVTKTLYRYDLVQRKIILLSEILCNTPEDVGYILEKDRKDIIVSSNIILHTLERERIDPLTGETIEWIAQYIYLDDTNYSIAEEDNLIYEIILPKGESEFFITEYDSQKKTQRLLCEVDPIVYYNGWCPKQALKVEEDIYFMDYSHYLSLEEKKERVWPPKCAYCKVNIKTCEVSRVSEEIYEQYYEKIYGTS